MASLLPTGRCFEASTVSFKMPLMDLSLGLLATILEGGSQSRALVR